MLPPAPHTNLPHHFDWRRWFWRGGGLLAFCAVESAQTLAKLHHKHTLANGVRYRVSTEHFARRLHHRITLAEFGVDVAAVAKGLVVELLPVLGFRTQPGILLFQSGELDVVDRMSQNLRR